MKKTTIVTLVLLVILAVGAAVIFARPTNQTKDLGSNNNDNGGEQIIPEEENNNSSDESDDNMGMTALTMEIVAEHNSASSCWAVIRGNAYDLTGWISQHPGGRDAILQTCGTDATSLFVGQHAGSPMQENMLASFLIGPIVE